MASYTHEYSNFPTTIMERGNYKDVDDTVAVLINQLKTFQKNKDYKSAILLIAQNPSLKQYIIGVDVINKIIEEIRNTQIYAKTTKQTVYIQDKNNVPISAVENDVWIC